MNSKKIVLAACLILLATATAHAQVTGIQEGFEDGNYDDWTTDYGNLQLDSNSEMYGTYSILGTSGGNDAIYHDFSTQNELTTVKASLKSSVDSANTGYDDFLSIRFYFNGTTPGHVFEVEIDNGDLLYGSNVESYTQTYTGGTIYDFRLEVDDQNNEGDVYINDNLVEEDVPVLDSSYRDVDNVPDDYGVNRVEIVGFDTANTLYADDITYDTQQANPPTIDSYDVNTPLEDGESASYQASVSDNPDYVELTVQEDGNQIAEQNMTYNSTSGQYEADDVHTVNDENSYSYTINAVNEYGSDNVTDTYTTSIIGTQPQDISFKSLEDGQVVYPGDSFKDEFQVDYTHNDTSTDIFQLVASHETINSEGEQIIYDLEFNRSVSDMERGETEEFKFEYDLNDIPDRYFRAFESSGGDYNLTLIGGELNTEYNKSESGYINRVYEDGSRNLETREEAGLFYNSLRDALNWFNNQIIDPIVDLFEGILNSIESAVDAAASAVQSLFNVFGDFFNWIIGGFIWIVKAIIDVLALAVLGLLDILFTILGLGVTAIINTGQFLMFYNADVDFQYNNTTYDEFNETNASYIDVASGDVKLKGNQTQSDRFDSLYSTNPEKKSLLTWNNEITLVSYRLTAIRDIGNNADENLNTTVNESNSTG